jgi:hypothetical protein
MDVKHMCFSFADTSGGAPPRRAPPPPPGPLQTHPTLGQYCCLQQKWLLSMMRSDSQSSCTCGEHMLPLTSRRRSAGAAAAVSASRSFLKRISRLSQSPPGTAQVAVEGSLYKGRSFGNFVDKWMQLKLVVMPNEPLRLRGCSSYCCG